MDIEGHIVDSAYFISSAAKKRRGTRKDFAEMAGPPPEPWKQLSRAIGNQLSAFSPPGSLSGNTVQLRAGALCVAPTSASAGCEDLEFMGIAAAGEGCLMSLTFQFWVAIGWLASARTACKCHSAELWGGFCRPSGAWAFFCHLPRVPASLRFGVHPGLPSFAPDGA